jgi:hypothetical protein
MIGLALLPEGDDVLLRLGKIKRRRDRLKGILTHEISFLRAKRGDSVVNQGKMRTSREKGWTPRRSEEKGRKRRTKPNMIAF